MPAVFAVVDRSPHGGSPFPRAPAPDGTAVGVTWLDCRLIPCYNPLPCSARVLLLLLCTMLFSATPQHESPLDPNPNTLLPGGHQRSCAREWHTDGKCAVHPPWQPPLLCHTPCHSVSEVSARKKRNGKQNTDLHTPWPTPPGKPTTHNDL